MRLLYHPHAHEFEIRSGRRLLDRLLAAVGTDLMQLELDLYWVKKAGLDPAAVMLAYRGIVPLIHVKDADFNGNITEVGRGTIDWPSIFHVLKDAGVKYYFVEQDESPQPLESAKMNLDYLKLIGAA